jgi:peptidoglycan/LPS O-acetylase OafA/YrhL
MPDADTPVAQKRGEMVEPINDDDVVVAREVERRPWPIKALILLLTVQGAALLLLGLYNVEDAADLGAIMQQEYFHVILPFLGLLALVAAVGFLTLRPGARVIALLVQALTLLVSLIYYFDQQPESYMLYLLMFYCVITVIYLNFAAVPAALDMQPGTGNESEGVTRS